MKWDPSNTGTGIWITSKRMNLSQEKDNFAHCNRWECGKDSIDKLVGSLAGSWRCSHVVSSIFHVKQEVRDLPEFSRKDEEGTGLIEGRIEGLESKGSLQWLLWRVWDRKRELTRQTLKRRGTACPTDFRRIEFVLPFWKVCLLGHWSYDVC